MDGGRAALADGWRAVQGLRWAEAQGCFEDALRRGDRAAAHDGLGLSRWFLGDLAGAMAARERAFETYDAEGHPGDAARCGVWVAHQHHLRGRTSAARGWLARAERVLVDVPECAGHGWVAVERARHAAPGTEQASRASAAVAIARRTRDPDLEVFALSLLGRAEVAAGRLAAGVALLEEAMTAATAGRMRNPHTLGEAYCNLITACTDCGDWERANEWCEVVDGYARESGAAPLFGACRGVHADVLLATGHWPEAEEALETALDTHARNVPELGGPAAASLAELRVRQGRLEDAERLLAGRDETPSALRALALLRVAQRRPREAVVLLERGLHGSDGDALRTGQLLATLVDARLAAADLAGARTAASRLAGTASEGGLRLTAARSDLATARVALARGLPDDAAEPARRSLAAFLFLAMPVDAAVARLELARALATSAPDVAADEAAVALAVLDEVGATTDRTRAEALLRRLGRARGSRPGGLLTAREAEVLELVAQGLTNAQVAHALVISEKTAGHHVSHILTRLGVRNRTEAAARLDDVRASRPGMPRS